MKTSWLKVSFQSNPVTLPSCVSAAPVRHMAFGVPGGSSNMTYFVLCGGGLTAAVVYVSICDFLHSRFGNWRPESLRYNVFVLLLWFLKAVFHSKTILSTYSIVNDIDSTW